MKIYLISNVKYSEENRIHPEPEDVLVFLNKAFSADFYRNEPCRKILFRRDDKPDYGPSIPWMENRHLLSGDFFKNYRNEIWAGYDWNYHCKSDKDRGPTTGYMAAFWAEKEFPQGEIVLVNFGYKVKKSTFRCEYHNWQFEAEYLKRYKHVYTADLRKDSGRSVYIITTLDRMENEAVKPVITTMNARGYRVNVMYRANKAVWDEFPDIDRTVQPDNADVVVTLRKQPGYRTATAMFRKQIELACGTDFAPENAIRVVYCADERAVPLLKMSAETVLKHNRNAHISVLSASPLDIPYENIVVHVSGYNFRRNAADRVTAAAYLKLFIPEVIPGKAIYLDCDTLCTGPLDELYETTVPFVGICHSHNCGLRQADALGLPRYGLTAMLLYNCDACKSIHFTPTLMRCMQNLAAPRGGWFHDETLLNAVYNDILTFLPLKWCYCLNRDYSGYGDNIAPEDAVIRHYIGGQKDLQKLEFEALK